MELVSSDQPWLGWVEVYGPYEQGNRQSLPLTPIQFQSIQFHFMPSSFET